MKTKRKRNLLTKRFMAKGKKKHSLTERRRREKKKLLHQEMRRKGLKV